jgi:hypothetical protein
MSQNFKTTLKYGFWQLIGSLLILIQVYKYFMDTLEFNQQEGVILFVGSMFIIRPSTIPQTLLGLFGKKKA